MFQRAITLDLPPRKIKFFFKKFVAFETERGDPESVERVRQLARNYVAALLQ